MPTWVTITVDTEEEWDWHQGYPTRGPLSVGNIAELPRFQEICNRYGAAVTYFVNWAVLADPSSRSIIRDLARQPNVEIGFHIHPWNTPPLQPVEHVAARESFLHNLPWELASAKLETVWDAFVDSGLRPVSYRGGRYSTSPAIQNWLRDRGFRADCSVVPFTTWADEGAPDFRDRDMMPRRLPPRHAGDTAFWELPLSLGVNRRAMARWAKWLAAAEQPPWSFFRVVGLLDRLRVAGRCWLNLEHPLGDRMLSFVRFLRGTGVPALGWTMHSSSLRPGGNPYVPTPHHVERVGQRLQQALEEIARHPDEFVWATSARVAEQLENSACA